MLRLTSEELLAFQDMKKSLHEVMDEVLKLHGRLKGPRRKLTAGGEQAAQELLDRCSETLATLDKAYGRMTAVEEQAVELEEKAVR